MKDMRVAVMILGLLSSGCGGGTGAGSSPTAPTTPAVTSADVTGIWEESTGGSVTWQLTQTGTSVTGTSQFSQNSGPFLGAVSGEGVISGNSSSGTFTFTDTYATLSRANCSMVVTGSLTLSNSTTMTGRYSETDSCNGATLGSTGGAITMRKR